MAIWDTIKKSISTLPGDLYNTGKTAVTGLATAIQPSIYAAGDWLGSKLYNTGYQPPHVTTPAERAGMLAAKDASDMFKTQSQVQYPSGSSGVGGSAGAGGLDYWSNRGRMTGEVSKAYDPLRGLLEKEMNEGIPDRYKDEQKTIEKRKPLNQKRYEAMLALLNQGTEMNAQKIQEAEDTGLGGARAREAASGLYNSSILSNMEQNISEQAMKEDLANQANALLKGEQYKNEWETSDQGVDEALANLFTRKDTDIQNTLARLLGIPADMLTSIDRGMGGVIDAANANTNAFNAWNSAGGGGAGSKLTYQEVLNPETGRYEGGWYDPYTGQLVNTAGGAMLGTEAERDKAALTALISQFLGDDKTPGTISPEENKALKVRFPGRDLTGIIKTMDIAPTNYNTGGTSQSLLSKVAPYHPATAFMKLLGIIK
jgi:hypothetical protein